MASVTVYMRPTCGYSQRALALLRGKGVDLEAVDISEDAAKEREMVARSGRTTTPQIFIHGRHVGGSDDLQALDETGELEGWLGASMPPAQGR